MTPIDRNAFVKLISDLAELFGKELKPGAVDLYWDALKDLALSTVQAMAKSHAKHGRFFPKPLELRPAEVRDRVRLPPSKEFLEGETRAKVRLDGLLRTDPEEWRRQVTPKVYELGTARGMLPGEIEAKIRLRITEVHGDAYAESVLEVPT